MNQPNTVIAREEDKSKAAATPTSPTDRPRLKGPRHRNPLAIILTFAGVAFVWLAIMWGVFEVMQLHSGDTVIPAN